MFARLETLLQAYRNLSISVCGNGEFRLAALCDVYLILPSPSSSSLSPKSSSCHLFPALSVLQCLEGCMLWMTTKLEVVCSCVHC